MQRRSVVSKPPHVPHYKEISQQVPGGYTYVGRPPASHLEVSLQEGPQLINQGLDTFGVIFVRNMIEVLDIGGMSLSERVISTTFLPTV